MGKIEKLVVLAVLFVSAIVVAVSLHGGGDDDHPLQPFDQVAAAERGDAGTPEAQGEEPEAGRDWLRDEPWTGSTPSSVRDVASGAGGVGGAAARAGREARRRPTAAAGTPASGDSDSTEALGTRGASQPDGMLAATPDGAGTSDARVPVEPNFDDYGRPRILLPDAPVEDLGVGSHRAYTVRDGDTWTSLARRFFVGGTKHREVLQRQNETVERLRPGMTIAVPVYDFLAREDTRAPLQPRESVAGDDARTSGERDGGAPTSTPASGTIEEGWYVVQSGDTLSEISKKVYGTATRWREIYEANRTRLAGPDWLDVGVRLQIP